MTESQDQARIVRWCEQHEQQFPVLKLLFHVPNGMPASRRTAARFVGQGLKRGVPDLVLPCPTMSSHGLYLELKNKASHHGTSFEQDEFIAALQDLGYRVHVCWSPEEAVKIVIEQVVEHMSNKSRKSKQSIKVEARRLIQGLAGGDSLKVIDCPGDQLLAGLDQTYSVFVDFVDVRAYPADTLVQIGSTRYTVHYADKWPGEFVKLDGLGVILAKEEQ